MRVETDLIGTKEIDQDAYYGLQTLRAYENFNITGRRAHPEFIRSLAAVKKAAAITNCQIGELSEERRDAIVQACDEILAESCMMLLLPIPSRAAQAPLLI